MANTNPGEPLRWLRSALTVPTDDCIEWPFAKVRGGYGSVLFGSRTRVAHHVALILVGRPIPVRPLEARHTCNRPSCVNPRHLIEGTSAENKADQLIFGTRRNGNRIPAAKLTESDVRIIRSSNDSMKALARRFGVCPSTIKAVLTRETWRHVV